MLAHGIYAPYFPQFILNLSLKHLTIIISPDYTLLPHKDGLAVVQADVLAFHEWLHSSFVSCIVRKASEYQPDVSRLLLASGSAGGYVAMSHALAFPKSFQGLALLYPMINFDTEWWQQGSKAVGAMNPMQIPDAACLSDDILEARIGDISKGPKVTLAEEDHLSISISIARAGLFHEIFSPDGRLNDDEAVWLNGRVEKGEDLPQRIWVIHGDEDSAVPAKTSLIFEETTRKQGRPMRLDVARGRDHGFDGSPGERWEGPKDYSLAEKWVN